MLLMGGGVVILEDGERERECVCVMLGGKHGMWFGKDRNIWKSYFRSRVRCSPAVQTASTDRFYAYKKKVSHNPYRNAVINPVLDVETKQSNQPCPGPGCRCYHPTGRP
jgi:hypothetical protein